MSNFVAVEARKKKIKSYMIADALLIRQPGKTAWQPSRIIVQE